MVTLENCPLTPKTSSKRQSMVAPDLLDCQSLQRSLKRVRLSSSPGELCLHRDLRHLVVQGNWISRDEEEMWQSPQGYMLERPLSDPLRLLFRVQSYRCWILIPRLYPHRPPQIRQVQGRYHQHILIADPREVMEGIPLATPGTAVYLQWNPVRRLEEVLQFCAHALLQHGPTGFDKVTACDHMTQSTNDTFPLSNCSMPAGCGRDEADRATEKPDAVMQEEDEFGPTKSHRLEQVFPPNRFDWGFERLQSMYTESDDMKGCD
jgi:ubiquitin-protein ligase